MSRKGDCWENKRSAVSRPQGEGEARHNACSETLFGSLKVERLHGMRFESRREAKDEVIDWLLWYNSRRLHSTLGYVSPMQYEQRWLSAQPKTVNM